MYKYQFQSTNEDLLDAEKANRDIQIARPLFRGLMIALGIAWFIGGVMTIDLAAPSGQPLIWLLLGGSITYYLAIAPYLKRKQIKRQKPDKVLVSIELQEQIIKIHISDIGDFQRTWEELTAAINTENGILFHFDDKTINWLPSRIFKSPSEKDELIEFIKQHNPEI